MIPSWAVIAGVAILVSLGSSLITPEDSRWFRRLRRPSWLTFEWAIPIIWTVVFICGGWSAYLIWERDPGSGRTWLLMAFYVVVEMAIIAYTPGMLRTRSLRVGTLIGATGTLLGAILAVMVFPLSTAAGLLLVPYLLWSPIGTFTTWQMMQLNPVDA